MKLTREQVVRFKEQADELHRTSEKIDDTSVALLDSDDVERYIEAHERFADTFTECEERLKRWGDSGQAMTPDGQDGEPPR